MKIKKIISFVLFLALMNSLCICGYADTQNNSKARAVIGLDLTDEQIEGVYQYFGFPRGTVPEFRMSNEMERQYLEGYVDSSVIGTRSISCVYIELKDDGSGMEISTNNITWCTSEMYMSALATAGITDAKIIVTAPVPVSGTAALTGVYWAYEDITGNKLSETAKLVSTQELTITGDLAEEIGNMNAVDIVDDLKLMLDETATMTDEELAEEIRAIANEYNVVLTDKQVEQLITLCRSLESVREDDDALIQRVQNVQDTLKKLKETTSKVEGFVEKTKKAVESVRSFFNRISGIIGFDNSPQT